MPQQPTYQDVLRAAKTLQGHAIKTPLVHSTLLNEKLGAQVFFKPECLQRTGSFKFRGAFYAMSQLAEENLKNGIVACSSGNHAQGVAEAARLRGCKATILMPQDAPKAKIDRTKRSGAEVVFYDRQKEDREVLALELSQQLSAPLLHPYEDFNVIAGQGTCGLEICEELEQKALKADHVLVCAGGGGLMAGILLAVQHHFPNCLVHSVEPEGHDDQRRSHLQGKRCGDNVSTPSLCDAILTPMPGINAFEICKGRLGEGLCISDQEALKAVAFAFHELKLVVEPGGAAALAALLAGKLDVTGKTVVATLSGGNIDADMMQKALTY